MEERNVQENTVDSIEKATGAYSFHLSLFSEEDEMYDLWLPRIPEGFFRITDKTEHRFLSIVAQNGRWNAVCRKPAFFRDVPIERSYYLPLEDGQFLTIDFEDRMYALYVEAVNDERLKFKTYPVNANAILSIGSHPDCDICYENPHLAPKHTILYRIDAQWRVESCGSSQGLYITGIRKNDCKRTVRCSYTKTSRYFKL